MKKINNPELMSEVGVYNGTFAILRRVINNVFTVNGKHYCKEAFTRRFNKKTKYFAISHNYNNHVAKFLEEIQNKLKLSEKNRLHVIPFIDKRNASLIQVSKWWRANGLRREFLAVMLQNICKYPYNYNFDAVLYTGYSGCTKNARKATYKFLFKRVTKYFGRIGGNFGWQFTFSGNVYGKFNRIFRMF